MTAIALALVIIAILWFVCLVGRPDEFRVTRSTTIAASPAAVFAQVNDFHHWDAWSPWARLDPACKNTFAGPPAGKDAQFAWEGNNKVGAGRMTITDSRAAELVRIRLEFLRPFKATNTTEFTVRPQGNGTEITWTMSGKNNFMSKLFGVFVDCEQMVGKDFEKGLAGLQAVIEGRNQPQ